jgi:hypothetical protein
MDGHLVSKPASKAEIELGSSVDSGTPEEAGVLASLRGRLAKQAEEIRKGGGARDLIIPSLMLSRTTCRPSRNSWRCPGSPSSRSWGLSTRDFQFFVFKLVSCDEKLLQLLLNRLREIPDIAQTLLRVRAPGYSEQAVVPLGLSFALLFDLQTADDAAGQDDAGESRRVVDHHDVEGIAVIGSGRWHEPSHIIDVEQISRSSTHLANNPDDACPRHFRIADDSIDARCPSEDRLCRKRGPCAGA